MTAEAEFLEEIAEHPDDPACRAIYADWLEERSDPRAEFVRLQCALAELPEEDNYAAFLLRRQNELLAEYEMHWVGPLNRDYVSVTFHRGLIESAAVNTTMFRHVIDDLESRAPTLQRLRLVNRDWQALRDALQRLHNSTLARSLRRIDVLGMGIYASSLKQLEPSRYSWLRRSWFSPSGNEVQEDCLRLLVNACVYRHLEMLDLRGVGMSRWLIDSLLEQGDLLKLKCLLVQRGYNKTTRRLLRTLRKALGDRLATD